MQRRIVTVLHVAALGLSACSRSAPHDAARAEERIGSPAMARMDVATGAGETYAPIAENGFIAAREDARSTFSIDVDTAAYSNVRRFLEDGALPPEDAVRIEEMINYFDYDYAQPTGDVPFAIAAELGVCPWNSEHVLAHIGLQGKTIAPAEIPARNLVFLLDVSGSMTSDDKLPLVQRGLGMLVDDLRASDRVAIVVYAGASGVVLEPTSDKSEIMAALQRLQAGGSTNGGAGIELAYRLAEQSFVPGGTNRVILATDGDFNVGTTGQDALVELIEAKRASGVFLSVLGFGTGNLRDSTMEMLADKGNGNYAYIDSIAEARKVLVEEGGATLTTIAKDVKIQVGFDPARVAEFRLIGYENRIMDHRDFTDDSKDAGEIGAGHSVTALYELVPTKDARPGTLMTVDVRYKQPDGATSQEISLPVGDDARRASPSDDFRFSAAVAELGMLLRHSPHAGSSSYDDAIRLAEAALGSDARGYRRGFVELARRAAALAGKAV